jgi:hypothetical protein
MHLRRGVNRPAEPRSLRMAVSVGARGSAPAPQTRLLRCRPAPATHRLGLSPVATVSCTCRRSVRGRRRGADRDAARRRRERRQLHPAARPAGRAARPAAAGARSPAARTWDIISDREYGADVDYIDQALARVFGWFEVPRVAVAGFSDGASYALSSGSPTAPCSATSWPSRRVRRARPDPGQPRVFISHGTTTACSPWSAAAVRSPSA